MKYMLQGYILCILIIPPPSFKIYFCPPTNKFAEGEAKPHPTAGKVQLGLEDPTVNFFEFIAKKDAL